jgi:hypothetical protein
MRKASDTDIRNTGGTGNHMRRNSTIRQRRMAVPDVYSLEGRVLMSTAPQSMFTQPPADVRSSPHNPHAAVRPIPSASRSTAAADVHPSHRAIGAPVAPTARRWSWLANTYWYVPTSNLSAVLYDSATGTVQAVSDQTVFHITGYGDGYFWGDVVTQLGSGSASDSSMLGSVTPQGKVLLTFTSTGTNSSPSLTDGYGNMVRKFGQWTMENQMFTSPNESLQIGHWAYMLQTRLGMPSWYSLPGAEVSVPVFLNQ